MVTCGNALATAYDTPVIPVPRDMPGFGGLVGAAPAGLGSAVLEDEPCEVPVLGVGGSPRYRGPTSPHIIWESSELSICRCRRQSLVAASPIATVQVVWRGRASIQDQGLAATSGSADVADVRVDRRDRRKIRCR